MYHVRVYPDDTEPFTFFYNDFYQAYSRFSEFEKTDNVVLEKDGKSIVLPPDFQLKHANAKFLVPVNGGLVKVKIKPGQSLSIKTDDEVETYRYSGYHLTKLIQNQIEKKIERCPLVRLRSNFKYIKGFRVEAPPSWKRQ